MLVETIQAGQWIFTEGGVPEYSIYRLLEGKVSVHKSGRKIRELDIKKGDDPVTLGITAILRNDRMHMASVRAETDVKVDRIYIDHIRGILQNEVPKEMKGDIDTMISGINLGNEIVSLVSRFADLPKVDIEISDNSSPETVWVLSEIKRLYELISADVDRMVAK